jgi:hypothetical protein
LRPNRSDTVVIVLPLEERAGRRILWRVKVSSTTWLEPGGTPKCPASFRSDPGGCSHDVTICGDQDREQGGSDDGRSQGRARCCAQGQDGHPEAVITYVRKRNARGDRRHPHSSQIDENPAERAAGRTAQSRSSVQTVRGTIAETMPDPMPKPPGRPPGEPIIIKDPFRPPEAPEIDGSLDEEEEEEIQR